MDVDTAVVSSTWCPASKVSPDSRSPMKVTSWYLGGRASFGVGAGMIGQESFS